MTTDKPRIIFTMEPFLHKALTRFAIAEGRSVSSVVRRVLEASVPDLERIADELEQAQRLEREAIRKKQKAVSQIGGRKSGRKVKPTGEAAPDGPAGPPGAPAAGRRSGQKRGRKS